MSAQIDAYGGRAILQKLPDDPHTGEQAAMIIRASGFSGCWVVALGTNDTANVAAGAGYTRARAIDRMMSAIDETGATPVMWVDTFTTRTSGYWANANMRLWNDALSEATARWPNLRVFDWAAIAATGDAPFSDGIHHTSAGYDVRNAAIARALVEPTRSRPDSLPAEAEAERRARREVLVVASTAVKTLRSQTSPAQSAWNVEP